MDSALTSERISLNLDSPLMAPTKVIKDELGEMRLVAKNT